MIAVLAPQLLSMLATARKADADAHTFATSLIPLLPHKVGDVVDYSPGRRFRVARIYFDARCYSHKGQYLPGFRVIGTQTIGNTAGSTTCQIVLDVMGNRVTFGPETVA